MLSMWFVEQDIRSGEGADGWGGDSILVLREEVKVTCHELISARQGPIWIPIYLK